MILFFLFIAVVYLVAVFAVTLPYWYETGNSSCEDIPSAPWAFRPVVRLWLDAAWTVLLLGVAIPLDPVLRRLQKNDNAHDGNMPPVLLVHGLYHNASGWMFLRRHLRRAGFRKIHTFSYSSWKNDIPALRAKLETAVTALEQRYPGKKPLLVGHSLGGLLIRAWLADEANQQRALGAVTLGAPHRGSKIAVLAFGKLGRSLVPDNPFFAELARTEKPASIPCVSLVSEADTMVLPPQNLVPITKGWELRLTPYAAHAGVLVKGPVLRLVVWELHRIAIAASRAPERADPTMNGTAPEPETAPAATPPKPSPTVTSAPETALPDETPAPAPATPADTPPPAKRASGKNGKKTKKQR